MPSGAMSPQVPARPPPGRDPIDEVGVGVKRDCAGTAPSSGAAGGAPDDLPRERDVVFRRPLVADGEPEDVASGEARVRDEDLAAPVHALEDRLVLLVGALPPEADDGERPRRGELPAGLLAHPALEQLRESHRLADPRLQALAAVAAEHGPE